MRVASPGQSVRRVSSLVTSPARALRASRRVDMRQDVGNAAITEIFHSFPPHHGQGGIAYERGLGADEPPLLELVFELHQLVLDHCLVDVRSVRSESRRPFEDPRI